MSPPAPSFSIVVVTKNPGLPLREALASVWSQEGVTLELIVIDGASSDGTAEWLASERARITVLVSEPDQGVYDAMNKALRLATGAWVYFLGADDRLVGTNLLSEILAWSRRSEAGVLCGEISYSDGRIYKLHRAFNPVARNFLHHQGAFYQRSLFLENGVFDTSLALMADYDFNVRLWRASVRFKAVPLAVARCASGGLSDAGGWNGYREEIVVRHRYYGQFRCLPWDVLSLARYARKRVLRSIWRT